MWKGPMYGYSGIDARLKSRAGAEGREEDRGWKASASQPESHHDSRSGVEEQAWKGAHNEISSGFSDDFPSSKKKTVQRDSVK
jgi:hypothetical protein